MNETIKVLQRHRSFRHFDDTFRLPEEHLQAIIQSAQQAPSWMNGQHYSIVQIESPLREKISKLLPAQTHIQSASVFLIFCIDMQRMQIASEAYSGDFSAMPCIDTLVTATSDCAFSAQNAVISAESLGYGICYIGSIRDVAQEIISLIQAPKYTYPIFGLCIGKPSVEMRIKPRLPEKVVFAQNHYPKAKQEDLAQYEQTMIDFAEARETLPWREKFARYYSRTDDTTLDKTWITQGWCSHDEAK